MSPAENGREGVFRIDAEGILAYADRRTADILGYNDGGEMTGRHFGSYIVDEDLPLAQHSLAQRRLGEAGVSEYRVRRKDGRTVLLRISSVQVLDANRVFLGVTGFIRDIGEQKRSEEIRAHELRLLRRIAGDASMQEVLDDLCLTLQSLASRPLCCAVMIADAAGDTLRCLAAPSLPEAFRRKAAYPIRDSSTTCARAIRSGGPVIVADAQADEVGEAVLALRRLHGYGAVWSHPVLQEGVALGTLAFLPDRPGVPSPEDERLIEFGIQVARLALAHEHNVRALRASEQRFRDFADLAADWFWEQDAEFRFTGVTYGPGSRPATPPYYDRDVVGKQRWDLPYVNVPADFWDEHRRRLAAGEPFSGLHLQRRTEDGGIRHVEISGRPLFDEQGRLAGYRGVGRDITARVAAEQKTAEANEWLQLATRAAHLGVWERDIDSWEFKFSSGWRALFGYDADEISDSAAQYDRLVHPDDRERIHAFARAYLAKPEGEYSNKFRVLHKDGSWRWVLSRGSVVVDAASGRPHWMGCHIDITEQHQAQEALAESEQRFHDYADMAADWFWEQDAEFRFTTMSGGVVNKGGFRIADSLGRRRWELPIEDVDTARWAEHRAQLDRHETFRDFIYCIRTADGTRHWYAVSGKPFFAPNGVFLGYRGTARDITARMQAEQTVRELNATLEERVKARTAELEAANQELDAFNYSVSHDLRAPLRSALGFSQALLEDYPQQLDDTGRDYLQRVCAAAQRMGELIDAMYHLSKLSRSFLQIRPVDLSARALAIAGELRQGMPGRIVEIVVAPGIAAEGDPGLLSVLLGNLLGNAWKYTAHAQQARIAFFTETGAAGETVYCVRDNGAGFDMLFADKLFKLFQRLHREEDFAGQGIGLVTAQRVVRRHGGRIWASAEKGRGATFRFTLWDDRAVRREAEETLWQRLA